MTRGKGRKLLSLGQRPSHAGGVYRMTPAWLAETALRFQQAMADQEAFDLAHALSEDVAITAAALPADGWDEEVGLGWFLPSPQGGRMLTLSFAGDAVSLAHHINPHTLRAVHPPPQTMGQLRRIVLTALEQEEPSERRD